MSIVVELATAAKEGLALTPLWTHPAYPQSN
ncbi:Ornithine racemase [Pseudoalteromonas ulvae UL12]|nr:Ornithine racemase [Pseudoalteromonas ulvae UL12]